jgi:predicted nucleic acid-binding protein
VKFLLDTNIVSEHRKRARADANVAAWFATVKGEDLYLSVLAVGELHKGLERLRAHDIMQANALARWIESLHAIFANRVVEIDLAIAEEWGRMNAVRPLPAVDGLMAASAKVRDMTFVTRDEIVVTDLGVRLLNPFKPAA